MYPILQIRGALHSAHPATRTDAFEAAYVPRGRHNLAMSGSVALRCGRCSLLHHLSTLV